MTRIRNNEAAAEMASSALQNGIDNIGDSISATVDVTTIRVESRVARVADLSTQLKEALESAMKADVENIRTLSNNWVAHDNARANSIETTFGGRSGEF